MKDSTVMDRDIHLKLAKHLFNYTWDLMEKPDRTELDEATMIHAAHASRFHWGVVGTPLNFARGEWQISRAYSLVKRPEPALHHAERCLVWCQEHNLGDFDLAYAHEALARAYAVQGNADRRDFHLRQAAEIGERIAKDEDRALLFADLEAIRAAIQN